MSILVDLHSHSTCSDGTNTPSELLEQASKVGIEIFALTDHDTIVGLDEARCAAQRLGIKLINGVEISCQHRLSGGYGSHLVLDKIIHIVALGFYDVDTMHQCLQSLQDSREQRGQRIVERLSEILPTQLPRETLFHQLWQAVLKKAGNNPKAIGRAHIGQVLYEMGFVTTIQAAFDKYLADNKAAYVAIDTMDMKQTIDLIHRCGGLAVLAHPTRYKLSATRTQRLIDDFALMGGDACELPNNEPQSTVAMVVRAMAKHSLLASQGSDFHGSTMPWRKLGKVCPLQKGQTAVWQRL